MYVGVLGAFSALVFRGAVGVSKMCLRPVLIVATVVEGIPGQHLTQHEESRRASLARLIGA